MVEHTSLSSRDMYRFEASTARLPENCTVTCSINNNKKANEGSIITLKLLWLIKQAGHMPMFPIENRE